MSDSRVPWWLELSQDEARQEFTKCATCHASADSVDVVCTKDDTALTGGVVSESQLTFAAYVLRALVVLAALAVGYLRWAWPAYVVGVILGFVFAMLFLRNHRAALTYLSAAGALVGVSHGLWATLAYPHIADVAWIVVLIALTADIAFIVRITAVVSDDGVFPDLNIAAQTAWMTSAGVVTVCAGTLAAGLAYSGAHFVPRWLMWGATHVTPLAASIVAFAILVSSILYTLASPVFSVDDVLHYREIIRPILLQRLVMPDYTRTVGAYERIAATVERILIGFANGLTSAVEAAYNRQWRGLVNGFARTCIEVANCVYRWIVKTARHIARVGVRCIEVMTKCSQWCWILTRRFASAFIAPVFLAWIACAELWWFADEIRNYVLREAAWATPIASLLRIIFIIVLLSATAMFMLRVPATAFGSKLAATAGVVGGRAFLFFVFIAWTLGLFGWATDGPFRVGWVTLTSTGVVVASLVTSRARRAVAVAQT